LILLRIKQSIINFMDILVMIFLNIKTEESEARASIYHIKAMRVYRKFISYWN
jgi:hypothetical protein